LLTIDSTIRESKIKGKEKISIDKLSLASDRVHCGSKEKEKEIRIDNLSLTKKGNAM
jgi:hypothetical protein